MTRMTTATLAILRAVAEAEGPVYALQIVRLTGCASGVVSPVLHRFEACGWLVSEWEPQGPRREPRPPRRYFRFTPSGVEAARAAFAGSVVARRLGVVFPVPVTE